MKTIFGDAQFRRRALFVLGNLAAGVAIAGIVVLPVYALFADRENRIEAQKKVLVRLAAIAAQAAHVQSIVSDTNAQMQGGEFLAGPNENVISADLQTRLKAMAEAGGAKLRAVQALPVKTVDQSRYSGSRIEIFGSLQAIVKAVHSIESSKPYLFITGATLKSPPQPRQGGSEEPVVQAQLDIFGAIQIGGQP